MQLTLIIWIYSQAMLLVKKFCVMTEIIRYSFPSLYILFTSFKDGRLHVGDQVLALNDESLVGVPQQRLVYDHLFVNRDMIKGTVKLCIQVFVELVSQFCCGTSCTRTFTFVTKPLLKKSRNVFSVGRFSKGRK